MSPWASVGGPAEARLHALEVRCRAELGERRAGGCELERGRVVVPKGRAGEPDGDPRARLLVRRLERAPLLGRATGGGERLRRLSCSEMDGAERGRGERAQHRPALLPGERV